MTVEKRLCKEGMKTYVASPGQKGVYVEFTTAMPRSTRFAMKKKLAKAIKDGNLDKISINSVCKKCKRCGHPKTKEYGHHQRKGHTFCPKVAQEDGYQFEQWLLWVDEGKTDAGL